MTNTGRAGDLWYGLTECADLRCVPRITEGAGLAFEINIPKPTRVYPSIHVKGLLGWLLNEHALWQRSAILVTKHEYGQKRVRVFGPSLKDALKQTLRCGDAKMRFAPYNFQRYENEGTTAGIVVKTSRFRDAGEPHRVQVEIWQRVVGEPEVLYVHAHLDPRCATFTHLDGALIRASENDLHELVNRVEIGKDLSYEKQFRLGRETDQLILAEGYRAIRSFFPIDDEVDECFAEHWGE